MTETAKEEKERLEREEKAREEAKKAADNLPTKEEADKLEEKKHKDALAAKEKLDKENEAYRLKKEKEENEENERKAKIQKAIDGEAVSIPASKKVERYNTEDGMPPRYEAGNLEPINAKKIKTETVVNQR